MHNNKIKNNNLSNGLEKPELPLTVGQKGLWFLHQLNPLSDCYNVPLTFKLPNHIHLHDLEKILNVFIQRHDMMRSTFHESDGVSVRRINTIHGIKIAEYDIGSLNHQDLLLKIRSLSEPTFNLEQAPLLRVSVLNDYQGGKILLIVIHHLIFDGASLKILCNELELIYQSLMQQSVTLDEQLDKLKYDYNDFQKWQQQWLQSDDAQSSRNYWLDKLSGELPYLNLSVYHSSNEPETIKGDFLKFPIPVSIVNRFKQLARDSKCSEYLVWLIAYFSFLSRYTSQDDIIVGTPSMGRPDVKFDDLVGYFVNLVPLRCQLEQQECFIDLLKRFKNDIYEALMHADYPLPEIINSLGDSHQRGDQPLFQTSFIWAATEHLKLNPESLLGLEVDILLHESGEQNFSLELFATNDEIDAIFKYRSHCFSSESILKIKHSFINFIDNISLEPDKDIQKISLLTEAEEKQLLHDLSDTQADYPSTLCIHQLFEQQVENTPDNIAIIFEEQSLSYLGLNKRVNQLAHYLVEQGVKPDDIVGLCMQRSLEMMIGLLAILKAGAAYLPLDPAYPKARLEHMIKDSGLSLLLTQQALVAVTEGQKKKQLILDNQQLLNTLANYSQTNPSIEGLNSRHLAYVIYTSGSTGLPKGVMVEHQALLNRIDWMQKQYQLTENDVILQKTPFSFDVSVWEFSWFFTVGARLVMATPEGHKDPNYLSDVIQKNNVTTIHFVPSMLRTMLANHSWSDCHSLRQVFCSGEALPVDIPEQHYGLNNATLHNLYGPTEAAIDVSYWQVPNKNNLNCIPIGKPIQNVQLLVLNAQLQLQPHGLAGELYIGGSGLARAYLNQPELTKERFIQNPFSGISSERLYKTGDMVRYLSDGNLEFIGRIDDQVKIRGFRIELGEIEQQLATHPDVQSSLVIVNQDNEEKKLVAYVTTKSSMEDSELINSIRSRLYDHLPDYMVPSLFVILEKFPLTANGKVDRKALPQPDGKSQIGKYTAPDGETELMLTSIWSDLLKISAEKISADANFFQLGGHSLLASNLINEVKEKMSLQIDYKDIFSFALLRDLATAIDHKKKRISLRESLAESHDESVIEMEW